jgi:NADH-quinone oxidoreductase subunit M
MNMDNLSPIILSLVTFIPAIGGLLILLIPRRDRDIKVFALVISILAFVASLHLPVHLHRGLGAFKFEIDKIWITTPNIHYHMGVDGISVWLVVLTTFLTPLCVLISWTSIHERVKEFFILLLILETALIGVFTSLDLFLFYFFWEATLIPMALLIGVYGHGRRVYAAVKFFLYTMVASVFMLAAILWLYAKTGSFDFVVVQNALRGGAVPDFTGIAPLMLFLGFFIAFAVKAPLFPFHTWLPDAHTEAPTAGSVVLASVLLKMGTYGFLRFSLPLLPESAKNPVIISAMGVLSLIGIVYGALACLMQKDWKKLVAYSSVSHLGFCTLGIFSLNPAGISGSILQQINHGISTGMLFLIVGVVYERRHTREISEYGGLLKVMPVFTIVFLLAALSSMGMPPLNGFIGELTILSGAYQMSFNWAVWAAIGIALGAAYLLWLFQRTMLGEVKEKNSHLKDLSWREIAVFTPLVIWAFVIGLNPQPYFRVLERPVAQIVERVRPGYYAERHLTNPLDPVAPRAALR